MSYKSRQKKRDARREHIAIERNRNKHPKRWYLTIVVDRAVATIAAGRSEAGRNASSASSPKKSFARYARGPEKLPHGPL